MFPDPELSRKVISTLMSEIYPNRIPVGIVVNNLVLGGNTQSILDLIKTLDCRLFHCLGVAAIKWRIDNVVSEELSLRSAVFQYDPNLWDKYRDKIVLYVGCFPAAKCNNGTSVFISNSSSNYIKNLAEKSKLFVDHWAAVSPVAASVLPNPDNATIIINCVDLYRCRQVLGRDEIRRRWNVSDSQIVVGYVGRVVDDGCKVIDVIAAATAILGDRYIPVFVGPISLTDKDRLRSINKRCIFVKECYYIGDILAAIDCFVLISRCEGCSLALMEAWAAGVPTIATSVGCVPYFNEKYGELSVVVDPKCTAEELSQAIMVAISNDNSGQVLRAKEVIQANYNLDEHQRRRTEYLTAIYNGDIAPNQPFFPSETPVSVVVAVYNTSPKYLDECYASIANQTWPCWELIFVDDGSSQQQTLDKLYEIARQDRRVTVMSLPHHAGVATARNVGLNSAKYDLVAVMDSDDIADPKWLARMVAAMKANPDVDICGCQIQAFDDRTGEIVFYSNHRRTFSYDDVIKELRQGRFWAINHGGSIYRKKKILSIGGYRESINRCIDLDLWLRAFSAGFRFYNLPDCLIKYRRYRGQLTSSPDYPSISKEIVLKALKLETKNSINTAIDTDPGDRKL